MSDPNHPQYWDDNKLVSELRRRIRFEHAGSNQPVDGFSFLLCEAVCRILERQESNGN